MKKAFFLFFTLLSFKSWGQVNKFLTYKKEIYPSRKYITQSDTLQWGSLEVITTMIHPKKNTANQFACRAWLYIRKNRKTVSKKFYDIDPVGSCSGLYLPSQQPLKDYFIVSKFGDYDGETLLIDASGKLTTLQGGAFAVSKDGRYLFANYSSDIQILTIYDLKNHKILMSIENMDGLEYQNIYDKNGTYYVSYFPREGSLTSELGFIDFQRKRIQKTKVSLKQNLLLPTYNEVWKQVNCNCSSH